MTRILIATALAASLAAGSAGAAVVDRAANAGRIVLVGGQPRVVYVTSSGGVRLARPRPDGSWTSIRIARPRAAVVVDARVERGGTLDVLLRSETGVTLLRQTRSRVREYPIVHAREVGQPGLTVGRDGRPVIAYGTRRENGGTTLGLARVDAHGTIRRETVTRPGAFAADAAPNVATYGRPDGIHVFEVLGAGGTTALDWRRSGGDWLGRVVFRSTLARPVGTRVSAVATPAGAVAAFTTASPDPHVVMATHTDRWRTETTLENAAARDVTPNGELAAVRALYRCRGVHECDDEWASLVRTPDGAVSGLDGNLSTYVVGASARHVLLDRGGGLEYFRSALPLFGRLTLTAMRSGDDVVLEGRVGGTPAPFVDLYRGGPDGPGRRVVLASVPVAADGSFAYVDRAPPASAHYRAVAVDPATGVPFASTEPAESDA